MELQNMVRSLDGIPAVLGACGPNHVNQIRNWAIQTINQVENPYLGCLNLLSLALLE